MNESFRAQNWGYIKSNESMGTIFDKALYKGYTDASFTEQVEQPSWAGYQGPILRAEVGDMVEVDTFHLLRLQDLHMLIIGS